MTKRRYRRDERPTNPAPMVLTDRDKAIVRAVYEYRVLKQQQIADLFFGTEAAASRVLLRLYHHRYLDRRLLPVVYGKSPNLYVLDRRGADLLRAEEGLEDLVWYPSSKDLKLEFLDHTLALNDVRIAVTRATQDGDYELRQWRGEGQMKADYDWVDIRLPSGRSQRVSLIPDSYAVIRTPLGVAHLFWEIDRGSTTTDVFLRKILAYQRYQASGAYSARYNAKTMRVLTVTTSRRRLENLKTASEKVGADWRFLFTVADDLTRESVLARPIWWACGSPTPQLLFT